jgi:hypothetical protein
MTTTFINNTPYYFNEQNLYSASVSFNKYDISNSVTQTEVEQSDTQWQTLKNFITRFIPINDDRLPSDDTIKQLYLSSYSQILESFIVSSRESVFLRESAFNTSNKNVTGLDVFKQIPFYQIIDIQQLKESSSDIFGSNPCLLMDSNQKNTIEPIKLSLMRSNFQLFCRTVITTIKLQNVFLTSVFNNEEFYKSDDYYDSTLIDYCYQIFLQKINILIPKYYKSIKTFLYEELKTKVSNGEEIVDSISGENINFDLPLLNDNFEINIDRYMKKLFVDELLFITQKVNTLFSLTGSDPSNTLNTYSLAPSSSFGNKLYSTKEYFIESLYITGIDSTNTGNGTTPSDRSYLQQFNKSLFLELSSDKDLINNTITTFLKIKITIPVSSGIADIDLISTDVISNLTSDLTGEQLTQFMINQLFTLKEQMLQNAEFLLLTNYLFPTTKILNISSLYFINLSIKTYENLNKICDSSIKAISTVHDMILGNNLDNNTPSPVDTNVENMVLGVDGEIIKAIATAPILIFKGLQETFDLNINIASKIRIAAEAAGGPKLPIIPYSLGLLPVNVIPPPFGIGPPITPGGFIYWAIDSGEIALSNAKDGFNTNSSEKMNNNSSQFNISKDPLKPNR